MKVFFTDPRLQAICNDEQKMRRKLGPQMTGVLQRRMHQLEAADSVDDLFALPGRWHPLSADRSGQMSGDLVHPKRLIIEPADPNDARIAEGGIDWKHVSSVVVVEITDTHK